MISIKYFRILYVIIFFLSILACSPNKDKAIKLKIIKPLFNENKIILKIKNISNNKQKLYRLNSKIDYEDFKKIPVSGLSYPVRDSTGDIIKNRKGHVIMDFPLPTFPTDNNKEKGDHIDKSKNQYNDTKFEKNKSKDLKKSKEESFESYEEKRSIILSTDESIYRILDLSELNTKSLKGKTIKVYYRVLERIYERPSNIEKEEIDFIGTVESNRITLGKPSKIKGKEN